MMSVTTVTYWYPGSEGAEVFKFGSKDLADDWKMDAVDLQVVVLEMCNDSNASFDLFLERMAKFVGKWGANKVPRRFKKTTNDVQAKMGIPLESRIF